MRNISTTNPTDGAGVSARVTLIIVAIVQFMVPFLSSGVVVALPTIGAEFNASAVQLSACITAMALALSMMVLPASRFADIHGRKRIFTTGIGLLTLTCLVLALSTNIYAFIALRFVLGMAAAMIFSTGVAILTSVFPVEQRGRALGISVAAVYLGMAVGPSLAGFIIAHLGWRAIFYVVLPFELFSFILTLTKLNGEWTSDEDERFDWMGSLTLAFTLLVLVIGATHLTVMASAKWLVLLGAGLMVFFVRLELKAENPLLDLHLLRTNLPFSFYNIATLINYASAFSVMFIFSIYLQDVKGYAPNQAGTLMIIQPAVQARLAPYAGRLYDRYTPRWIATIGMALCAAGLSVASFINTDSHLAIVITVMVFLGVGFGLFSTANTTAIMGSVEFRHYGIAAGLNASMRNMGMLICMTVIALVLSYFMGSQAITPSNRGLFVTSMHTCFTIFSGFSVFGIVFSLGGGRRFLRRAA